MKTTINKIQADGSVVTEEVDTPAWIEALYNKYNTGGNK